MHIDRSFLRGVGQLLVVLTPVIIAPSLAPADESRPKHVLVLVEGAANPKSHALGDGRQLAALLGHFHTQVVVEGVDNYVPHSLEKFDYVFYIGFHIRNRVPAKFLDDLMATERPITWIHTGFAEFSSRYDIGKRFGFRVTHNDSASSYDRIRSNGKTFTKTEPNINIVQIVDRNRVQMLATAVASRTRRETPYIVRSGNLLYVADSPFASADPTDRYLLFADMLHDILHEPHEESHTALIRIEDVNALENPDRLREIADILSRRGIPFLVGVTPFYVNPGEGMRVSLSDKPEIVDALKYMVRNGGTIVMHGSTHQYKGVTAADYEFWDEATNGPIKDENAEAFSRKIEAGIQEFMKNGLYPLAWETPHYTASFLFYGTIARYFSTAVEQRLSIEDFDYSQYFPYVIAKDLFGQRIYPENLGYVPLESGRAKSEERIQQLVNDARVNLQVRDGFASCFFHAFVDLGLLEQVVDSIQHMGYTFMDLREQTNWVKTKDQVILSGNQSYSLILSDQYLSEVYFNRVAEPVRREVSERRVTGPIEKYIELPPGQFYKAEPTEFRERHLTLIDKALREAQGLYNAFFGEKDQWKEARPVVLWNHFAKGGAYNDQASLTSVFRSVNIPVDTIFVGQQIDVTHHNLVIVPFAFVDSLQQKDFDHLVRFVESGGTLVTDTKNDLADGLGIRFSTSSVSVTRVQDRLFPEERIVWRFAERAQRFDLENEDEVFCIDNATEAPLAIGRKVGRGKVIFFSTQFDPYSQNGYSQYPFFLEYVRQYFRLGPIVRRDGLEMYFDPGFRHTQSIEYLVQRWVASGIRRIHVAGWHQYPKYTYDYDRLIRLAHANGILVYLWLEPPQVSQKFWAEHPEWREKNYRGDDVRPSWRYPVALTDSACVQSMTNEYLALIAKHDWDGVNIAELYFEAGKGLQDPNTFTPMHPSAQRDMRRLYNVELRQVFDPGSEYFWRGNPAIQDAIIEYRVSKLTGVYEILLEALSQVAHQRSGFQIIVTAMDSFGSPELTEEIGVDMRAILQLQAKYQFLLQVEDPERRWSTDPGRYVEMGKQYTSLLGSPHPLLLDLNILSFRKADQITPFPTLIQTGTEGFQLVRAASLGAPRSTIYAESSINPQDMIFLPYAFAADVRYRVAWNRYDVESPYSFVLRLPDAITEVSIDGTAISPVRENLFLVPAGRHTVVAGSGGTRELSTHQIEPRIVSLTGSLLAAQYDMRTITFEYDGEGRVLASFNREPTTVEIDNAPYMFTLMKGNDCYTIFLPGGRHSAAVGVGDTFSYGVNITSFWSTVGIALFGLLAVTSLIGMYVGLAVVRRRAAVEQKEASQ